MVKKRGQAPRTVLFSGLRQTKTRPSSWRGRGSLGCLSPRSQIRLRERNELRPGVDKSVDAADVGVCATTSDTEAQRSSSERNATPSWRGSPDLPCRYSYRHLSPSCPHASTHRGCEVTSLPFPEVESFGTDVQNVSDQQRSGAITELHRARRQRNGVPHGFGNWPPADATRRLATEWAARSFVFARPFPQSQAAASPQKQPRYGSGLFHSGPASR